MSVKFDSSSNKDANSVHSSESSLSESMEKTDVSYEWFVDELVQDCMAEALAAKTRLAILTNEDTLFELEHFLKIAVENAGTNLEQNQDRIIHFMKCASSEFLKMKVQEFK